MPGWQPQLVAAIATLPAIWLLVAFAWGDRAKGRRRCPRCWYDMSTLDTLMCPECGNDAKRPQRLLRTHRRWRRLFFALAILLIAFPFWLTPRVQRSGWPSVVPAPILALALTLLGEPSEQIEQRLVARVWSGGATRWERLQVARWAAVELPAAADATVRHPAGQASSDPLVSRRFNELFGALAKCKEESRLAEDVVRDLLRHDDYSVRAFTITAIGWHGADGARYFDQLMEMAADDVRHHREVANAFGVIGPPARPTLSWLCEQLADASTEQSRNWYLGVDFDLAIRSVVARDESLLLQLLDHESGSVRALAVRELEGAVSADRYIEIILPLLGTDPSPRLQSKIIDKLVERRDRINVAPILIGALANDEPLVRERAAFSIRDLDIVEARAALIAALEFEPDHMARYALILALADIARSEFDAIAILCRCLEDPNTDIAVAAALALGTMKARQALPALRAAASGEQPFVRRAATQAIQSIESAPNS